MTPQQIFDTVARHLFAQGFRSLQQAEDAYSCAYRGTHGTSCAVGVLIPDHVYTKDMEGIDAEGLCHRFKAVLPAWMLVNMPLLLALQTVHDVNYSWKSDADMKFSLSCVADRYNLDQSVLKTLAFKKAGE